MNYMFNVLDAQQLQTFKPPLTPLAPGCYTLEQGK